MLNPFPCFFFIWKDGHATLKISYTKLEFRFSLEFANSATFLFRGNLK